MFENFEKLENVELKNFSTMKTGGRARVILFPKTHLELIKIWEICSQNNLPLFVLGNGSNVLFDDNGFDGVIVSLKHFDKISVCDLCHSANHCCHFERSQKISRVGDEGVFVRVGAGINLFALNLKLKELGLSGLEWSYGIPATLGGMVVSNGGCFGHEIGEFVEEATVLCNGRIKRLKKAQLKFAYRVSNLRSCIVLNVKLRLTREKPQKIAGDMAFFLKKKRETQPCDLPSLGSIFKRIAGEETIFPAKIFDQLGLKGTNINGAELSTKHAGFVVNKGGATSADVLQLIRLLEDKLKELGLPAEKEIIILKK